MTGQQVVIVIEGGCVTNVGTTGQGMTYRVIDIDGIKSDGMNGRSAWEAKQGMEDEPEFDGYVPDAEFIDVKEYIKHILEGV